MYEQERRLIRMIRTVEQIAKDGFDGHLTIMRFTTGWKIMLGTPDLTIQFDQDFNIVGGGYGEIKNLPSSESLEEALEVFFGPGEFPHCERDHCCDEKIKGEVQ